MAELVTYEDSPLAQYLQEIDAAEDTITEKYPYEARRKSGITELAKACDAETDIPWNAKINIAKLLTWILGPSEKASLSRIAATVWEFVANTLALSGHLAERYTPKPARRYENLANLGCWRKSQTMRTLIGVSVGGLVFSCILGHPLAANRPITGALVVGTAAFTILHRAKKHCKIEQCTRTAEIFIDNMDKLSARSRTLDITIQKAMRFIQEVVFVSKGFRVPQYAGAGAITSRPGRGTLWAAGHLQQTVVDALVLCIQALFDTLDALIASTEQRAAGDLVQPCDSATMSGLKSEFALLNGGNADGINPMEQLHSLFELHFAARKLWLEAILSILEHVCAAECTDRNTFLSVLKKTSADIEQILAAVIGSADAITKTREAQFTAKSWEALSDNRKRSDAPDTSNQPVVRCLSNMANAVDTIGAKLVVCKGTIGLADEGHISASPDAMPFDEVARVFASLKADIDTLAGLYQEAMTNLALDSDRLGSTSAARLYEGKDYAQYTADDDNTDRSALSEDARVFVCTPFGASDMNAADLVFEADPSDDQLT
ncbi:hypothetical protein GGI22_002844, partial [Coemansia erecta]